MVQMESSSAAKRLWHIARVVFYMLRKGLAKDKLMMDLHLLLKRGKIAGKAIGNLVTFHHHHHHGFTSMSSAFSCRSMDPNRSIYSPKAVEFSCSNTPSRPSFHAIKRKNRHRRYDYDYDAVAVAKAFEILNSQVSDAESVMASPSPSPSPMNWSFGKSPAGARQLRITDSPFPLNEEGEEVGTHIDQEAEEFIKRFYQQLRLQQWTPMTPEYKQYRNELMGRA